MTTILPQPGDSTSHPPESSRHVAPVRVLVLDDEKSIRTLLGTYLQKHGFRALEAGSIKKATELLGGNPVDGLILDVRLPGRKSGIDLLAQLRCQPGLATTPAIVLTGGVLADDEQTAIRRHGAHLFYKPEGFGALVGFLEQLMGCDQPT